MAWAAHRMPLTVPNSVLSAQAGVERARLVDWRHPSETEQLLHSPPPLSGSATHICRVGQGMCPGRGRQPCGRQTLIPGFACRPARRTSRLPRRSALCRAGVDQAKAWATIRPCCPTHPRPATWLSHQVRLGFPGGNHIHVWLMGAHEWLATRDAQTVRLEQCFDVACWPAASLLTRVPRRRAVALLFRAPKPRKKVVSGRSSVASGGLAGS